MSEPGGVTVGTGRAPRLFNVANGLTALRIGLVPVFAGVMVAGRMTSTAGRLLAGLTFVVASLTDLADGWIARQFNLVTAFGKLADPIADKALTGTGLVLLSAYGALSWWVTAVIVAREVGVTALRLWVIRYGVIPASRGGKIKTVLQIVAIAWYIMPFGSPLAAVGPVLMALAVLVTVGTGLDYLVRAVRVRRSAAPAG